MHEATATITVESWGIRVRCACAHEQCYARVDDSVSLCSACGRESQVDRTRDGLTMTQLTGR